jgi:hypothetical protein
MMPAEVKFAVAGLNVTLRSADSDGLDTLSGFYGHYPADGAARLVVDITRVPGLAEGRERGPSYPGFERSVNADGTLELTRFDAEGTIELPATDADPVTASFRVGDSTNSLEAAIRIGASIALPRDGAFILHASAIEAAGECYVFAGVSGAGKSTIAAMLDDAYPAFTKVSDELVILAPRDGRWHAHVTPFIGSDGLPHGASVPIAGMHFLAQAPHHVRTAMSAHDAMRELMRHILVYVAEANTAAHVLRVASRFSADTPCYRLEFAKDPGVSRALGIA